MVEGTQDEGKGKILLESGVIAVDERVARQVKSDGTPTKLAADLDVSLEKLKTDRLKPAYYIVRVKGPHVAGVKAQMEAAGAKVVTYVQYYAFVVKMNGATLDGVAALEEVEWIGPYKGEHRIARRLKEKRRAGDGNEEIRLDIYLFSAETVPGIVTVIRGDGGTVEAEVTNPDVPKVRARVSRKALDILSVVTEVSMIHEYIPEVVNNDKATGIMGVTNVWNAHGLSGTNQIIGHADTGLDVGSTGTAMNADFRGRIAAAFALGRTNNNDWSDLDGHGTHTAGSILGNGTNSMGQYSGVAYKARLVHQSVGDISGALSGLPADYGVLYTQAYTNGARIHSDSWGTSYHGVYGRSVELDAWVWNGGSPREMLIVQSCGNDGPSSATITSPGCAKNCLTVGASQNDRPSCGQNGTNTGATVSFSSRGPTDEGRIKPDVVAPGSWVASVRTHGDRTVFRDDMEKGVNGWTEEAGSGPAVTPWTQSAVLWRSSYTSWNYTASGSVDDYLVTPAITLPNATAMLVQVTWRGVLTNSSSQFGIAYRIVSQSWTFPTTYSGGPRTNATWTWKTWAIPTNLCGKTVQFGLNTYGSSSSARININVDDFAVTTFASSDDMWAQGLATRGDSIDTNYTLMSGTSMATPLTAGSAALTREYYQDRVVWTNPSAALIKATLINGATDLTPVTPRPNNDEGWGRINLEYSLFPPAPRQVRFHDVTNGLVESETRTYYIDVTNNTEQLRATLAWSDRQGASLQNDLDLVLQYPDGTATNRSDSVNNVEGVDVSSPTTGRWTVVVKGATVPYGPQPYALILSGAIGTIMGGTVATNVRVVIYTNGFNSATPPQGWTKQTVVNGSTPPVISFVASSTYPAGFAPVEGTRFVSFNSYSCNYGCKARLFQTNAISTLGFTNVIVDFAWAESPDYNYSNDYVTTQWSTNGAVWNDAASDYRRGASNAWSRQEVALPSATAHHTNLYLAFLFTSRWGADCHLDDLRVNGERIRQTLTVAGTHGTATPPAGTYTNDWGAWLTNRVSLYDAPGDGTQYVCTGWTMSGNSPTTGTGTNCVLQLTNGATLTWLWGTNVQFTGAAGANGSVSGNTNGWYTLGGNVTVTGIPASYYHFEVWSGDVGAGQTNNNPLTMTMDRTRTVSAWFAENIAPKGTPEWWLASHRLTNESFAVEETKDTDGDGVPAWQERVADTDPTNGQSVLSVIGIATNPGGVRIDWKGGQWVTQYLQRCTTIGTTNDVWKSVFTNTVLPTPITNYTVDGSGTNAILFYRIKAVR